MTIAFVLSAQKTETPTYNAAYINAVENVPNVQNSFVSSRRVHKRWKFRGLPPFPKFQGN